MFFFLVGGAKCKDTLIVCILNMVFQDVKRDGILNPLPFPSRWYLSRGFILSPESEAYHVTSRSERHGVPLCP